MLIDLHLHTSCSDGVWPKERLFQEIRDRQLELFCVSDHDTVDAYPMPDDLRAKSIAGLEVDSEHDGHTAHILAYGVGSNDTPLLQALIAQRKAREERMQAMLDRLAALDIAVTMDEVRAQAKGAVSLGRPHLARVLLERGIVGSVQEAFDRYLADEGTGFVALRRLTSAQIVALIAESGGISSVAHPLRLRAPHHLDELRKLGADAVEIVHPTADDDARRDLEAYARRHGMLVTGGTDFHAPAAAPIGILFPDEDVARLRERLARAS
jgi:predicted metal-dependent phosphoesterase TrpH